MSIVFLYANVPQRSLETLSGHVVVCVIDNYVDKNFDGAIVEYGSNKLQLEQPHLTPSQLHAPDLIGVLKALRSRTDLCETPVIFLMLRPPSPLQLQEFEPYRGLVYFIAVRPRYSSYLRIHMRHCVRDRLQTRLICSAQVLRRPGQC